MTKVLTFLTRLFLVSSLSILPLSQAIWLNLPSSGNKCISEQIRTNVIIIADYTVVAGHGSDHVPTISVKVTSPYGNTVHHEENVTQGQSAFTTIEPGNYLICFRADYGHDRQLVEASVNIDLKIGIAAKDWDTIARKEKMEGVELELTKLEMLVESIHENIVYLRNKELEMRAVSDITNSRVAWYSIISIAICILVSTWELWNLKRFFRKKKLV